MPDKQSHLVFQSASEGQQKFDYFITGLNGAIFAYLVQAFEPERFGWNTATLEALALILLAISFFIGLKRLESVVVLMNLNHEFLAASEKAGQITKIIAEGFGDAGFNRDSGEIVLAEELPEKRDHYLKESRMAKKFYEHVAKLNKRYYKLRNLFLFLGFTTILIGKLIEPYLDTNSKGQQGNPGDPPPAISTPAD
jgi:hypothetical protein